MKIRLSVSRSRCQELREALESHGIEIDEEADLVLSEADVFADSLLVRDPKTGEKVVLPAEDIVTIESYGHTVEVYAAGGVYQTRDRLYQLAGRLDPSAFLRISNSVIAARRHIRRIAPQFSMKFALTMSDGRRVDVTRSYYYAFKYALGF